MLYTIQNDRLRVTVDTLGAQLMSLKAADGTEYLWQGDPQFWSGRAPVLFPFTGRLDPSGYQVDGKVYHMEIHGFARKMEFTPVQHTGNSITLCLCADDTTWTQYPFDFRFFMIYALEGSCLSVTHKVENIGSRTMYFGLGAHPGFNVPLAENENFEDYRLEFETPCHPDRICFSERVLLDGQTVPYPLEEDRYLSLSHGLFDDDAIFLTHMAKAVTLRSRVSGRGVCLRYPDMAYLGLWHAPKTEAPYLCIEPWASLPARDGITEDFSCRSDLQALPPAEVCQSTYSIELL